MNCPKRITEPWRRELWDIWCNYLLGETVTLPDGDRVKITYKKVSRMVSMAELLSLSETSDPLIGKMKKLRDDVLEKYRAEFWKS